MTDDDRINNALLKKDLEYIKLQVDQLREDIHSEYVRKSEFQPVQKIVYGLVSLILISVVGALLALIIK